MPKAKPSPRVLAKVTLECELVSIPLAIYTGTVSDAGVERHTWIPVKVGDTIEDHPVGNGTIDKETGELLTLEQKDQVVKKIETEYGPVFVEDNEIEKLFDIDPDTLVVTHFQPISLLHQGHYVPQKIMFVEPQKVGTGSKKAPMKGAVKALGHLLKGMEEENVMAVCELTTRGLPKPCLLMPDGSLLQVWHTNTLREQREFPEVPIQEQTMQRIHALIEGLTTTEPLDLTDYRSELVQAFADEKAREGNFGEPEADTYKPAEVTEDEDEDFLSVLQASIDSAKKKKVG